MKFVLPPYDSSVASRRRLSLQGGMEIKISEANLSRSKVVLPLRKMKSPSKARARTCAPFSPLSPARAMSTDKILSVSHLFAPIATRAIARTAQQGADIHCIRAFRSWPCLRYFSRRDLRAVALRSSTAIAQLRLSISVGPFPRHVREPRDVSWCTHARTHACYAWAQV